MEDTAVASETRYGNRKASGKRPASMEFPEDLYERLAQRARMEERSMAAITRDAVLMYLETVVWEFPEDLLQELSTQARLEERRPTSITHQALREYLDRTRSRARKVG